MTTPVAVWGASWLRPRDMDHRADGWLFSRVRTRYAAASRSLIARPVFALLVVLPFVALCYVGYTRVGTGFMPAMDEGGFVLDYQILEGGQLHHFVAPAHHDAAIGRDAGVEIGPGRFPDLGGAGGQ